MFLEGAVLHLPVFAGLLDHFTPRNDSTLDIRAAGQTRQLILGQDVIKPSQQESARKRERKISGRDKQPWSDQHEYLCTA